MNGSDESRIARVYRGTELAMRRFRMLAILYDEIREHGPMSAYSAAGKHGYSARRGHILLHPLRSLGIVEYSLPGARGRSQLRLTKRGQDREKSLGRLAVLVCERHGDTALRGVQREVARMLGKPEPPVAKLPAYLDGW